MTDIPADIDSDGSAGPAGPAGLGSPFAAPSRRRAEVPWSILAVVAAGGALGGLARYGLGRAAASSATGFPWMTFVINVSGCLLIGVLMVLVAQVWPGRRLLRPFLGTGLLGGYTTFSTYIVDVQRLMTAGATGTALAYLAGTLLAALVAVHAGMTVTRALVDRARRGDPIKEVR